MDSESLRTELERTERALVDVARSAVASGLALPAPLVERLERVRGTQPKSATRDGTLAGAELLRVAVFVLFEAIVARELTRGGATGGEARAARPTGRALGRQLTDDAVEAPDDASARALARDLLAALPETPASEQLLARLVRVARDVADAGAPLRTDFLGRLYHRLVLRGPGAAYATYYTSLPAARLLAGLALAGVSGAGRRRDPADGSLPGAAGPARLAVLDPACGSGTLLCAAHAALCDGARGFSCPPAELVLHGWDVMPYAAHLARTTLALHARGSPSGRAAILALRAGVGPSGAVQLGALDALAPRRRIPDGGGAARPRVTALTDGDGEVEVEVPDFDVVIMNPPFSRSANPSVKFGYSDARNRALMDARLRALTPPLGVGGIGHAGLAAYFVVLAHRLLRPGGRLAVVLPRSCLSGVSWAGVRELVLREYQLEYVIANADPGCADGGIEPWNWSEQTDLGEVMWVARKLGPAAERSPVRYANLTRKPRDGGQSASLAAQIVHGAGAAESLGEGRARPLTVGGRKVGELYSVRQEVLGRNWLFPILFADARLNALVCKLVTRPPVETVALGTLVAGVGPDIAQVKRAFDRADAPTPYPVLWGHQGAMDVMALGQRFLGYGRTRPGGRGDELHRSHAATLLLAERPHLHTEALLALSVAVPVLSTAFWELRPAAPELGSLLQLWFQSTFGWMSYLAHATSSRGDIFKLKKGQLARIPVVRPGTIAPEDARALCAELGETPWLRHPEEFARAARGEGPRKAIDEFFVKQLKLSVDLRPYYELLAADPVVTARRNGARG